MKQDYSTVHDETRKLDRKIFAVITLFVIIASLIAFEYGNIVLAKRILSISGITIAILITLIEFAFSL